MPEENPRDRKPILDYGRPPEPAVGSGRRLFSCILFGAAILYAGFACTLDNPSARVNIWTFAFALLVLGVFVRFVRI
jgi:hypothetical protein